MKIRILLIGLILGAGMSWTWNVMAADSLQFSYYNAKLLIDGIEQKLPKDKPLLLFNENAYVPLRIFTEMLGNYVQYNVNLNEISVLTPSLKLGPTVTLDQAKLTAYEKCNIRKLTSITLRPLKKEEVNVMPQEVKDKKTNPLYYIIKATSLDNEDIHIFVFSNDKDIYYVVKDSLLQ